MTSANAWMESVKLDYEQYVLNILRVPNDTQTNPHIEYIVEETAQSKQINKQTY